MFIVVYRMRRATIQANYRKRKLEKLLQQQEQEEEQEEEQQEQQEESEGEEELPRDEVCFLY